MQAHTTQPSLVSSSPLKLGAAGVALVLAAVLWGVLDFTSPWSKYPENWQLDIAQPLSDFFKYMARDFYIGSVKFSAMTRGIGWAVSQPFVFLKGILAEGFIFYHKDGANTVIPALPWTAITVVVTLVAWRFGGQKLALGTFVTFVYFAVFGIWQSAMLTLASVVVAVIISTFLGLLLGLWGYRSKTANAALQPVYDIMQTLPLFSYLVPMILFFGFGPIASLMATVIYALPPMARITTQAIHEVHKSVKEFGSIAGCSRLQMTWMVLVPAARKSLLLGVNQVIMMSLAVVIVASLIGAGGLGGDVLKALKSMRIGDAVVAGFAITFMAMVLDRLSYAIALCRPSHELDHASWLKRHWLPVFAAGAVVVLSVLSFAVPVLHVWPEDWVLSAGDFFNDVVKWISANYQGEINAFRDWCIVYIMKPIKLMFLDIPWISLVLFFGVIGALLGGWRMAVLGVGVFLAIAALGYWDKAMISLYLVVLSVILSALIGFGLGIWGGVNDRAEMVLIALVDVLQTMPMFVYLIPVVMLFSIGDFPALVAIIAYAIPPAIRYTITGIRHVASNLEEGARMSGCDSRQVLMWVKIPLALPTILLGLNQTIMMAFGMLVITALVGTRGLEEITLSSIARVKPGDGLLAGLAIAGMAIVFDRYIKAANQKAAYQLGIPVPK